MYQTNKVLESVNWHQLSFYNKNLSNNFTSHNLSKKLHKFYLKLITKHIKIIKNQNEIISYVTFIFNINKII